MKIGKWVKDKLKKEGFKFSVNDKVSYVNRKLYEAGSHYYIAVYNGGLAIFVRDY